MKNIDELINDICQAVNEYKNACGDVVNDKVGKSEFLDRYQDCRQKIINIALELESVYK